MKPCFKNLNTVYAVLDYISMYQHKDVSDDWKNSVIYRLFNIAIPKLMAGTPSVSLSKKYWRLELDEKGNAHIYVNRKTIREHPLLKAVVAFGGKPDKESVIGNVVAKIFAARLNQPIGDSITGLYREDFFSLSYSMRAMLTSIKLDDDVIFANEDYHYFTIYVILVDAIILEYYFRKNMPSSISIKEKTNW